MRQLTSYAVSLRPRLLVCAALILASACTQSHGNGSNGPTTEVLNPSFFHERLTNPHLPRVVKRGSNFAGDVTVTNDGDSTWPASGRESVKLGYRFVDPHGKIEVEGGRTSLDTDFAPHQTRTLKILERAPSSPGRYELEIDMVYEFVAWFSVRGGQPLRVPIVVK